MDTYVVLRRGGWRSPEDLQQAAERSTAKGKEMGEDKLKWIRSYVLEEGEGVGTVCIYQADGEETLREHAGLADLPVDEVVKVADTVKVREDPS